MKVSTVTDYPNKIISCRAVAPVIEEILGPDVPMTILDIALHLKPDHLKEVLLGTIQEMEEEGSTIVLGYGLCGKALEGVYSAKSTLVLPKVDDCVGMLLGSRARHRNVLTDRPGTYFFERRWLETELNIFTQMGKGLAHISQERRRQLLKTALNHYDRLVLLSDESPLDEDAVVKCMELAAEFEMSFEQMQKELGLIHRLVLGPWNDVEFVVVPPGTPIPLFIK